MVKDLKLQFEVTESGSKNEHPNPQERKRNRVLKRRIRMEKETTTNSLLSRVVIEETVYNKCAKEGCNLPASDLSDLSICRDHQKKLWRGLQLPEAQLLNPAKF
jgi:hypothetical protein